MKKSNWACTSCGTGFGRKFTAKRHVNTVHQGYASYVPWSEYLAGRRIGLYLPSEPPQRGTPKRTPTYWERMMDTMHEGFFDEMGRILARQAFTPTSYRLPTFASSSPSSSQYVTTPYFGENVFGIEAYVCGNCQVIKPGTFCYAEGNAGGGLRYRLYCPPNPITNVNNNNNSSNNSTPFGSSKEEVEEENEFQSKAKEYCFKTLYASVLAWMGNQPELIAVEVDDPNRFDGGSIIFLKDGKGKTFSITLGYSADKCIELDASKIGNWVVRAIGNGGRTTLNTSEELSEFLRLTQTRSYGFFRLNTKPSSRTFLMAIGKSGSNTTLRLKNEEATTTTIITTTTPPPAASIKTPASSATNISPGRKSESRLQKSGRK